MAVQIIKYRADDGSEWKTIAEAVTRDVLCGEIGAVMEPLGDRVRIDSNQYVQHDPATVIKCRVGILALAAREFPSFDIFSHKPPEEVHPRSIASRILDDLGGPLCRAWNRFSCIDEQGREYEQPYYAINGNPTAERIFPVKVQ